MGSSCFGTMFWHVLIHTHIGGSINGGTQNGLFSMENPIIGWFRGTPISGNLHLFEEWNMENGWSWPSWWYMLYYTFFDGSFIHKRLYTHCRDSHCGIDDHTPHTMVDHGQHLSTRGGTFIHSSFGVWQVYHIVWMCCLSVGEPGVWREHFFSINWE